MECKLPLIGRPFAGPTTLLDLLDISLETLTEFAVGVEEEQVDVPLVLGLDIDATPIDLGCGLRRWLGFRRRQSRGVSVLTRGIDTGLETLADGCAETFGGVGKFTHDRVLLRDFVILVPETGCRFVSFHLLRTKFGQIEHSRANWVSLRVGEKR